MSVIIVRGIPGSGKTTWVESKYGQLVRPLRKHETVREGTNGVILSTDDIFVGPGGYLFDYTKLGEAHAECLRVYVRFIQKDADYPVIVDNTNTTIAELAPYAQLATAYGHKLEIVTLVCDPVKAHARNVHGVNAKTTLYLDRNLRKSLDDLPPWWPSEVVFT
jgi:hypothetical protein